MADTTSLELGLLGLNRSATSGSSTAMSPLVQALLGNATTPEEVAKARTRKEGALSKVREAYASPMKPEDYSPFQEMVNVYLKNMVPGWNQAGLGRAVAAPYDRQMAEASAQHKEGIDEAKLELTDSQQELRDLSGRMQRSISAGASLGRPSSIVGRGQRAKVIRGLGGPNNDIPGHWMVSSVNPEERLFFPGDDNELTKMIMKTISIYGDKERQDPNVIGNAIDAAFKALEGQNRGAIQAGWKPGQPVVKAPATPLPAPLAGSPEPNSPSPEPKFTIDWNSLPPEGKAELQRVLDRAEARPDNVELQRNTTKQLADIARRYQLSSQPESLPDSPVVAPSTGVVEPKVVDFEQVETKKALGKDWPPIALKERENLNKGANKGDAMNNQFDLMEKALRDPNVPEGSLGPLENTIRLGLKSLGVPIDDRAQGRADLMNALATKYALMQRTENGENLMPGAMVTFEEKMLLAMAPGLSISKEGSLALIQYTRLINQSNRRITDAANELADKSPNKILPMNWETIKSDLIQREKLRLKMEAAKIDRQFGLNIKPEVFHGN